jgi:hypothetical protein
MREIRRDGDKRGDSRKLWPVGFSEVLPTDLDDPASARSAGRWLFLLAIAKLAPNVLRDLRSRSDDALDAWAHKWHLPAWVLPYAVATRRVYATSPNAKALAWIGADTAGALVPDDPATQPRNYDPTIETRTQYLAYMNEYVQARETAQTDRLKRPLKDPRAFSWLVQHVVMERSYADLWRADATVSSRNTIPEACAKLAALIDLPLPPGKAAQK